MNKNSSAGQIFLKHAGPYDFPVFPIEGMSGLQNIIAADAVNRKHLQNQVQARGAGVRDRFRINQTVKNLGDRSEQYNMERKYDDPRSDRVAPKDQRASQAEHHLNREGVPMMSQEQEVKRLNEAYKAGLSGKKEPVKKMDKKSSIAGQIFLKRANVDATIQAMLPEYEQQMATPWSSMGQAAGLGLLGAGGAALGARYAPGSLKAVGALLGAAAAPALAGGFNEWVNRDNRAEEAVARDLRDIQSDIMMGNQMARMHPLQRMQLANKAYDIGQALNTYEETGDFPEMAQMKEGSCGKPHDKKKQQKPKTVGELKTAGQIFLNKISGACETTKKSYASKPSQVSELSQNGPDAKKTAGQLFLEKISKPVVGSSSNAQQKVKELMSSGKKQELKSMAKSEASGAADKRNTPEVRKQMSRDSLEYLQGSNAKQKPQQGKWMKARGEALTQIEKKTYLPSDNSDDKAKPKPKKKEAPDKLSEKMGSMVNRDRLCTRAPLFMGE